MAYGNSIAGLVTRWGLAWGIQWWWRCLRHGFLQSNCDFTILQQCSELRYPVPELWIISLQVICWGCRLYPVKQQVLSWPIGKMRQSISEHSLVHEAPPHLKACAEWPWEYSILLNLKDPEVWSLRSADFEASLAFKRPSDVHCCGKDLPFCWRP